MAGKLNSTNVAVRQIERCKRGLGVTIIIAIASVIPALVAGWLAFAALRLIGLIELAQIVGGTLIAMLVGVWLLGNRPTIQAIGRFSNHKDD